MPIHQPATKFHIKIHALSIWLERCEMCIVQGIDYVLNKYAICICKVCILYCIGCTVCILHNNLLKRTFISNLI